MKKHNWSDTLIAPRNDGMFNNYLLFSLCTECGISRTDKNMDSSCPSWVTDQRGDAPQSGSQLEAGVLKKLYMIESLLMSPLFAENIYSFKERQDEARYKIQQLILKLEGQAKD